MVSVNREDLLEELYVASRDMALNMCIDEDWEVTVFDYDSDEVRDIFRRFDAAVRAINKHDNNEW